MFMMSTTSRGEIVQCLEGDGGLAVLVDRLQLEEPGLGEVIAKVDFGSLKHWWWGRLIIGGIS